MQKRKVLTTVVFRTRIHLSGDLSMYEHFVGFHSYRWCELEDAVGVGGSL